MPDDSIDVTSPMASFTDVPAGQWWFTVKAISRSGDVGPTMQRKIRVSGATERLADNDRFTTAVEIAREGWGGTSGSDWSGVKHVVLASGDDRAAADPLAAAGLCGVYDAPLFLVSSSFVPSRVKAAIDQIADDNPGPRSRCISSEDRSRYPTPATARSRVTWGHPGSPRTGCSREATDSTWLPR